MQKGSSNSSRIESTFFRVSAISKNVTMICAADDECLHEKRDPSETNYCRLCCSVFTAPSYQPCVQPRARCALGIQPGDPRCQANIMVAVAPRQRSLLGSASERGVTSSLGGFHGFWKPASSGVHLLMRNGPYPVVRCALRVKGSSNRRILASWKQFGTLQGFHSV